MSKSCLVTLFFVFQIIYFGCCQDPAPAPGPSADSNTTEGPIRGIYYCPTVIGDDPSQFAADLYTGIYTGIHEVFLPQIRSLGVTHVVVSYLWTSCKDLCHQDFLQLLYYNGLKLIIAVKPSSDQVDFVTAKSALQIVATELQTLSVKYPVVEGFCFYSPQDRLGVDAWRSYYSFVNEMISIVNIYTNIVEFPVSTSSGEIFILPDEYNLGNVNTSMWMLRFFGSSIAGDTYNQDLYSTFNDTFAIDSGKKIVAMVTADSYVNAGADTVTETESKQVSDLQNAFYFIDTGIPESIMAGIMINEFTDEWCLADVAEAGFDKEGCPSSNAFAHNFCGTTVGVGISTVEFTGLYRIRSKPFQFCIEPKEAVAVVKYYFQKNVTLDYFNGSSDNLNETASLIANYTDPTAICATISPWIPILPLPFPINLVFVVLPLVVVTALVGGTLCCGAHQQPQVPTKTKKEKEKNE